MPNEIKTDVVVTAKSKGFAKLRDEAGRLNTAITKGASDQRKGFDDAARSSKGFAESMEKAMRAVAGNRQGEQALRRLGKHFEDLDAKIRKVEASFKKADAAQGAFFQGMAQGLGAGEFIQRGPGIRRQVAGQMVGRAVRGVPGMAGAMFGGAGGLAQIAQKIPLLGGPIATQLQQAMGMAGGALQMQRQELGALPMMGGVQMMERMGQIRNQAQTRQQIEDEVMRLGGRARGAEYERLKGEVVPQEPKGAMAAIGAVFGSVFAKPEREVMRQARLADREGEIERLTTEKGEFAEKEARKRLNAERNKVLRRAGAESAAMFGGIEKAGFELMGVGRQEAVQFAGGLARVGGARPSQQMIQTAMAAQTAFGVGGDVSGQFLRAQRRGGVAGGPGGAKGLTDAISSALMQGLEGSEIVSHLQKMAQGIASFEQTGIPINPTSIGRIGTAVAGGGLGGTRGAAFAQQLAAGGQRIGRTGPTGAVDVLALQTLGGMRGTGAESVLQAMERLEEGDFTAKGLQEFTKVIAQQGRGVGEFQRGRLVRQAYQSLGIQVGSREARLMGTQALGGQLSPDQRAIVEGEQAKILAGTKRAEAFGAAPGGVEGLARTLVDVVAPNAKRQADISNKQLRIGEKMLPVLQNAETAMTTVNATFTGVMAPLLEGLTESMKSLAEKIEKFVKAPKETAVPIDLSGT